MNRNNLELLDYAIYFATKAHTGQKRKSDSNVDMIFHPFTVGMILQRENANTNCVIAGILHDVVEDTKYTIEDIKKEFGTEISQIVEGVTEDKSLPWKQRKIEAIEKVKNANLDVKLVESADKISNLETMYSLYQDIGEKIWESFKKPKEEQKWYYTQMYNAVIYNAKENELFRRYKNILMQMFEE